MIGTPVAERFAIADAGIEGIGEPMTLRIERVADQGRTVLRLIGRIQSEHLAQIANEIAGRKPPNQPLPMWYGRLIEV